MFHVVVNTAAADENVKQVGDKGAFNGASPGGAVGAGVDLGALFSDGETGAADGGGVSDFPWDAGGTFVFSVPHSALITVVEDFAHLVDGVLGRAFAPAVVVTEVAPAAVFVHLADGFTDGAGESSALGIVTALSFDLSLSLAHVLETGVDGWEESKVFEHFW